MISVHALTKTFAEPTPWFAKPRRKTVLHQLHFSLPNGAISAILGPNGAGKTTFLRILAGLDRADSGHITINGLPAADQRQSIAYLSDGIGLYQRLTGEENIHYFAALHGLSKVDIQQRLLRLAPELGLHTLLNKKVAHCSLGERMRIALARALVHDPHTIVLDEPTNGLDLASIRRLRQYLRFLASPAGGSKCILLSTHHLHEVERLASYVLVLVNGTMEAIGSPSDITRATGLSHFEDAFAKLAFSEQIT